MNVLLLSCLAVLSVIGEARWIPAARSSDVCLLPGSAGACRAGFPRYYYNAVDERCLLFSYGGCGGNKNNFRSKAECEFACGCIKACPSDYEPVCGTNGETFSNSCFLDITTCRSNNQILFDYEGECD